MMVVYKTIILNINWNTKFIEKRLTYTNKTPFGHLFIYQYSATDMIL